jgi:phage FluMu protein Com
MKRIDPTKSAYVEIQCAECGDVFGVFLRLRREMEGYRECPRCRKKMRISVFCETETRVAKVVRE